MADPVTRPEPDSHPRVKVGADPTVVACTSVYHTWPAEDRRRFTHCGTCGREDNHIVKLQNFGWDGTLAICTVPSCDWSETHEGCNHRRRAVRRAKHHAGIGPAVDDWGDPIGCVEDLDPMTATGEPVR